MVTKSYRAFVVAFMEERPDWRVANRLVSERMCDICGGKSSTWEYGYPELCERHARELNLLW